MSNVKLSIIILSYNQENYISQTIESVINQKHNYSYELIICDDASSDSTPQLIKDFAKKYPMIKPVLRKKNLGVVRNFYEAISLINGEYLMVCGGDDYYLDNKIKTQLDYLENNEDVSLLYSDIKIITSENSFVSIKKSKAYSNVKSLISDYTIPAPTMTIRVSDLKEYINEVNPMGKDWIMEDFPISIWFILNKRIKYLTLTAVAYRVILNSISHPDSIDRRFEFENSTYEILYYFQSKYPDKISKSMIIKNHLQRLCSYPLIISKYKSYCLKLADSLKEQGNYINYILFKLRIRSKIMNLFIRSWKKLTNI